MILFNRRGENGFGHCNHIGGVVFAIEDFSRSGLKEHDQPISCTSRLCKWNVPRNMRVEPQPVDKIVVRKIRYGKKRSACAKISEYDPRAPVDRSLNTESLNKLGEKLALCLPNSAFFLFHTNFQPQNISSTSDNNNIEIDSTCEPLPDCVPENVQEYSEDYQMPFDDNYNFASKVFKEMIDIHVKSQIVTIEDVKKTEEMTRGQSDNNAWRELKETILTASNFKKAVVRQKAPDKLLKDIMYLKSEECERSIPALEYGKHNEQHAVNCYIDFHISQGNVGLKVMEVGTILSRKYSGLGASLDRYVIDPMAIPKKEGGLEVKCPISKAGMSLEEACSDKKFYLTLSHGQAFLKQEHAYHYQVQGQMFVCELEWIDFVVWFGHDTISVERITFDDKWWSTRALPSLDYFYRRAFFPEVLTRRVKRSVPLYGNGDWICYKDSKKLKSK